MLSAREWGNDEWRTNYPPPPAFDGFEQDDWEDESYQRALSRQELAALVAAGIAGPDETPSAISIEEDEAERDAFFRSIAPDRGERVRRKRSGHGTI